MKEKLGKNTKIIILVVCIMLTIIGVAYSFIAPLISGVETESTISFNSGMIKITYNGSNVITGENIIPGWSETKEFTVVGSNNTSITDEDIMDYQIKLVVEENTFTDGAIRFELTGSSSNDADTLSPLFGKVPTGTGEVLVGTARFNQDENIKNDVTHTYSLVIGFPNDENKNQNEDMNKSFNAYVIIEEGKLQLSLSNYLVNLEKTETGKTYLRYDETEDNNLRYYGSGTNADDVPNYVSFNNELWRIIGVFDTYNADTGETEKAVKLIRNDSLGEYSWDTSDTSEIFAGKNFWYYSKLKEELNGDYLNPTLSSNQTWYNGAYNSKTAEFDISNVISYEYQQYIMNARWYLGGPNTISDTSSNNEYGLVINMYNIERNGEKSVNYCSYNICTETEAKTYQYWDGLIGLPYISDFGFATKHFSNSLDITNTGYCSKTYNWMSNGTNIWSITPDNYYAEEEIGGDTLNLTYFCMKTKATGNYVNITYNVHPSLYLISNTLITGGNGTSSNPYTISLWYVLYNISYFSYCKILTFIL